MIARKHVRCCWLFVMRILWASVDFPHKGSVTRRLDVFFDICQKIIKQCRCRCFDMPMCSWDVIVIPNLVKYVYVRFTRCFPTTEWDDCHRDDFSYKVGIEEIFWSQTPRAHINYRGDGRSNIMVIAGIILWMRPGSDEQVCVVTSSFVGRAGGLSDPSHLLS